MSLQESIDNNEIYSHFTLNTLSGLMTQLNFGESGSGGGGSTAILESYASGINVLTIINQGDIDVLENNFSGLNSTLGVIQDCTTDLKESVSGIESLVVINQNNTNILGNNQSGINSTTIDNQDRITSLENISCFNIVNTSLPYTASTNDFVLVDATSGATYVYLTTAIGEAGCEINIKKIDVTVNRVIASGVGGTEMIDGNNTFDLNSQYENISIVSDGSDWWIK